MKGIEYLKRKLENKRTRGLVRYRFYEQKQRAHDFGISTPKGLEWFSSINGWCTKAVDRLADRLQVDAFDNDVFMFEEMFAANNPDLIFDNAILSSLITSCCFVYISKGKDGMPRFQVIDGTNATGIIDERTELLTEGYAVLDRDEHGTVTRYAYFTPDQTDVYDVVEGKDRVVASEKTGAKYAALVPIIYRPDARRPFGHSRISRACMDLAKSAMRTVKRAEISAEFYSFPQKYATGLSDDAEKMDSWQATMSAMLSFTKDEDGDKPAIGQFQQQSMDPHISMMRMFASLFAGETGLTLDDMGFVTDNPSSAEAIKAAHENLRLEAAKAQRCFGVGFKNVGYIGACMRNNTDLNREEVAKTEILWKPVFEPDAAMMSSIGDGLIKLEQAVPGFLTEKRVHRITGID